MFMRQVLYKQRLYKLYKCIFTYYGVAIRLRYTLCPSNFLVKCWFTNMYMENYTLSVSVVAGFETRKEFV